jgi:hypothetical protein
VRGVPLASEALSLGIVLRDASTGGVRDPEEKLRHNLTCLSTRTQIIDLRRLRLHRRTDGERDQDGGGGNERLHAALL